MLALIIDGYVDEPACLGVPPYISPYIRYIAGALCEAGIKEDDIHYRTIDQLRPESSILKKAEMIVIVAGTTVPGKYLRGSPITLPEIRSIASVAAGALKILGGPIRLGYGDEGGTTGKKVEIPDIFLSELDVEPFVYDIVSGHRENQPETVEHRFRTYDEIRRFAIKGAFIIRQHPDYPFVVCELETYRGCPRRRHCSFCTEHFYGSPVHRPVEDVLDEVSALYNNGAKYFRIGRQPDLFMYRAICDKDGTPRPNPDAIERLYKGIRIAAPGLKVLHMDNANPGTLARYPAESREIAKIIVRYHTPGDVAALGMESADPEVVAANDLKASPEEVFEAIKLLNDIGSDRGTNGLPELLPGINIVHGLKGETKHTFGLNYEFLHRVAEEGYMVRRINIRQVMTFAGTPMYGHDDLVKKHKKLFLLYKDRIRHDIDLPMLRKIVPAGTILKDVRMEIHDNNLTFGRQLGSYPLLVGVPDNIEIGRVSDILVTDHGFRSITGVPVPFHVNTAHARLVQKLPGVGKKLAVDIIRNRPYKNTADFLIKVPDGDKIIDYLKF